MLYSIPPMSRLTDFGKYLFYTHEYLLRTDKNSNNYHWRFAFCDNLLSPCCCAVLQITHFSFYTMFEPPFLLQKDWTYPKELGCTTSNACGAVAWWLSLPQNFIKQSFNSGSAQVQIMLAACRSFGMVRISDHKNSSSS